MIILPVNKPPFIEAIYHDRVGKIAADLTKKKGDRVFRFEFVGRDIESKNITFDYTEQECYAGHKRFTQVLCARLFGTRSQGVATDSTGWGHVFMSTMRLSLRYWDDELMVVPAKGLVDSSDLRGRQALLVGQIFRMSVSPSKGCVVMDAVTCYTEKLQGSGLYVNNFNNTNGLKLHMTWLDHAFPGWENRFNALNLLEPDTVFWLDHVFMAPRHAPLHAGVIPQEGLLA